MQNEVEKELLKMADEKYLEFHQGILNDDINIIGVRIPKLREFAKRISKEKSLEYWIKNINENFYEEILLKGMLICLDKKLSFEDLNKYVHYYVARISNWALCDTFCSGLKITKKCKDEMWSVLQEYLQSNKEFDVRFALVMLLNYYIDEEHIYDIYKIINEVKVDKYYTKMANAWLISYCFMKYYDKTVEFYKSTCKVDDWTYNKGIQKAIESYRLTSSQKEELKKLKR